MTMENPKFQIFCNKDDQYYFRLFAKNGEVILASEGYKAKKNAENGIASVKKNATDRTAFEPLVSSNGRPYFVLKAKNRQVIGVSETYNDEQNRDVGIASVMSNAPVAPIEDLA